MARTASPWCAAAGNRSHRYLGRAAYRPGRIRICIVDFAFDRHSIFLARPGTQVDHFAAFGAERAERRFRSPAHRCAAARAADCAVILGHRLHSVRLKMAGNKALVRHLVLFILSSYTCSYSIT